MNQKSRQKTASSVERDFFQLLNNSNFRIHCRYNTDNCILEPIYNNFTEISRIKKFTTIFSDERLGHFFLQRFYGKKYHKHFNLKYLLLTRTKQRTLPEKNAMKIKWQKN